MIIDFSVQNFLSIREKQTLTFRANKKDTHLSEYYTINVLDETLLKIGLIMGANASGKTNILNALHYFRTLVLSSRTSKSEHLNCIPFLLDKNSFNENTIFEINFIYDNTKYYYEVVLNNFCIVSEKLDCGNNKKKNIYKRTTNINTQVSSIQFFKPFSANDSSIEALTNNTLWNNTVIGGFLKTNISSKELSDVYNFFNSYLNNLITPNHDLTHYISEQIEERVISKDNLLPILQKADFNISDILLKGDAKVNLQHITNNGIYDTIPFLLESLGTQRYYGYAGLLYKLIASPQCFMIDELEASLHPTLYQHFILSYCVNAKHSQLIASTHNTMLLNNKDIYRTDMITLADKTEDCATILYRLSDFGTSVIRRDTSNIYNAYNSGKLGGVPNLGDYYINIYQDDEN